MVRHIKNAPRGVATRRHHLLLGPPATRRLALTHAVDDFADGLVNMSLAGSLFFSVSLEASRSRLLLYLVLTAAPLAVAAPVVGPALDRTRAGYRATITGSQVVRSAVAVGLIGSLLSLAVYPLAFVVLICRKSYGLAKTALLTRMAEDREEFLRADAHITRVGTVVGGLGVSTGGVLLAYGATTMMLSLAAALFLLAGLISRRLPSPAPNPQLSSVSSLRNVVPAPVWRATVAVMGIRAAAGALTFLLAFAIRSEGDRGVFAAALLVAGSGGLVSTFVAPMLHRRLESDAVLVLALLVPGFVCAVGVVTIGELGVLAIALAIGLGNGVASRSVALLQSTVSSLARARAIARSEALFQLATVVGAGLAVQLAPSPRAGFAVTAVVLIIAGIGYGYGGRQSLYQQASRMILRDQAPAISEPLPDALLVEAQRLASLGAYRMAVVVADNAVQIAVRRSVGMTLVLGRWNDLQGAIDAVMSSDDQPAPALVIDVLTEAERVLTSAKRRSAGTRTRFQPNR